jgi:RHS repeat-associated protein
MVISARSAGEKRSSIYLHTEIWNCSSIVRVCNSGWSDVWICSIFDWVARIINEYEYGDRSNIPRLNRGLYAHYASATGPGVDYAYDALGRAVSATTSGQTLSYQYDAAGNRTQVTWPDAGSNALYVSYVYDVLNRVTQVEENGATSGPGLLASYSYDALGRRSSVARAGGSGAATAYGYDNAGRLYTLAHSLAGSAGVTFTFGYNAANQILTRAVTNDAYTAHPGGIALAYTANGLNQYTAASGPGANYPAGSISSLTYDPLGRLQGETAAGVATSFLYDGAALVGEYDANGNILRRYAPGAGADEPLVWYEGAGTSTRRWLTADNQGSVIAWADQSANAGATYAYGPYGEPLNADGSPAWGGSRYRYTGQIEIPEVQLYYFKARVYDPGLGRFYQTDPAGYASDVNSYAYAGDDPVNGSDPSGMAEGDIPPDDVQCNNCYFDASTIYSEPLPNGGIRTCDNSGTYGTSDPGNALVGGCFDAYPENPAGAFALGSGGGGGDGVGGGGRGGAGTQPQRSTLECAAAAASSISAAAALHKFSGLQNGPAAFAADAVGGNVGSSAVDLYQSFATGQGGGHSGYYNIGQTALAGPTLGIGPLLAKIAPKFVEANPGLVDLAEVGLVGAEYATGIAEAKLLYDAITFVGSAAGCKAGLIR